MQYKKKTLKFKDLGISIFLVFFSFIISCSYVIPYVCGVYHDDGIYASTAKSIAEGDGYRLINLPNSPKQTKYPIFYPFLLSIIWQIYPQFPQNIYIMKLMTSFLASIAIGICYLYFVNINYCSRFISFISCLTCLTSSGFQFFSTNLLSETPYLFLTVTTLWVFEKNAEKSLNKKLFAFILGIVLSLPFYCRTIGIASIFSAFLLWRFKVSSFSSLRWIFLGVISATLPWLLYSSFAIGDSLINPEKGYYTDYFGWFLKFGIPYVGRIFFTNSLQILHQSVFLFADCFSALYKLCEHYILKIIIILFGLAVWTNIIRYQNKTYILKWFLIFYLLIIVFWPWPPSRFLVAILPFLIMNFYCILILILNKIFPPKIKSLIVFAISFLFITTNLYYTFNELSLNRHNNYPMIKNSINKVNWESFQKLFDWIKINTPHSDILAYGIDPMAYLYTERKTIRPFIGRPTSLFYGDKTPPTGTAEDLLSILYFYKVNYLIQTAMPGFSEEQPFNTTVSNFLTQYPNLLKIVYFGDDPRFIIYQVVY